MFRFMLILFGDIFTSSWCSFKPQLFRLFLILFLILLISLILLIFRMHQRTWVFDLCMISVVVWSRPHVDLLVIRKKTCWHVNIRFHRGHPMSCCHISPCVYFTASQSAFQYVVTIKDPFVIFSTDLRWYERDYHQSFRSGLHVSECAKLVWNAFSWSCAEVFELYNQQLEMHG